jgi:hypothetical protein
MTDNTTGMGDETGVFDAQVQDVSTLDRIDSSIEVTYLSPAQEARILAKATTFDRPTIDKLIKFANLVRDSFKQEKLLFTFSVRSLLGWCEKIAITGSIKNALVQSWYSKLNNDDKAVVKDIYHQVFGESLT